MADDLRRRLRRQYAPATRELVALFGREFENWIPDEQ
jgi:hypothetical protein